MMRWLGSRVLWGLLLILGGILYLLQNLNIVHAGDLFWAVVLLLIGVVFLVTFLNNRADWWALIPGIILTFLGILVLLNLVVPGFSGSWIGPLFLAGIGLAFWAVYLNNHGFWWAIIPGGALLTLAVVAGLSDTVPGMETGGIFFLGLGVTFALLSVLPSGTGPENRPLRWALIPAAVLAGIGLIIMAETASLINYIWPALLILGGIYLVYLTVRTRRT